MNDAIKTAMDLLKLAKSLSGPAKLENMKNDFKEDGVADDKPKKEIKIVSEVKPLILKLQTIGKQVARHIEKKLESYKKSTKEHEFAAIIALFESMIQNSSFKTINHNAVQNLLRPLFLKIEDKVDKIKEKDPKR